MSNINDFSLLVNGKSIERKVFPSILSELLGVLFQPEPKVKGMFLFAIYKFFRYRTMSMGRGRGSNKLSDKEVLPKLRPLSTLQSVFDSGKAFLFVESWD